MGEDNPRLICVLARAIRLLSAAGRLPPEAAAEVILATLRQEGFRVSDMNPNRRGDFW
jgi:hypothetical protein